VARTAYKAMVNTLQLAAKNHGTLCRDLSVVFPHPGSKRILQRVSEVAEIPESRIWHTLNDTGNTSATSIPIAIDRYWDRIPQKEDIGFVAFGAGYTAAATIGRLF